MTAPPPPLLLLPTPQTIRRRKGVCNLPKVLYLCVDKSHTYYKTIFKELGAKPDVTNSPIVKLFDSKSAPKSLVASAEKDEGYGMAIEESGISIWARTEAGHLYGALTLAQLINQHGRQLPCLTIADCPTLSKRGIQLGFPQGHTEYRHPYMTHMVRQLARLKLNELYLYLESYFDFPSLPNFSGPGSMTSEEARSLDGLCKQYNIRLVPMLNVLGHSGEILSTQRYHHLKEYPESEDYRTLRGTELCTTHPETEILVNKMLDDILECFSSDLIHIGGDEVGLINDCPRCKDDHKNRSKAQAYLAYYQPILDKLQNAGRRGGIWGDMLLSLCKDSPKKDQRAQLKPFREKVVIFDWHYFGGGAESLAFFKRNGLETIAASSSHICFSNSVWPSQSVHQWELFQNAINNHVSGGMNTSWANYAGVQEEQFNYLHATCAEMLWNGSPGRNITKGKSREHFEAAWAFQRYSITSDTLTRYLHELGDAHEQLLSALAPKHGLSIRKCLYHSTNVLEFWVQYRSILASGGLVNYQQALGKLRQYWDTLAKTDAMKRDPYFRFLEGPLLMYEHLLKRYLVTEDVYELYDKAAKCQYNDERSFKELLHQASEKLLEHIVDFKVIETYLRAGHRRLGFDLSTTNRIKQTKKNIRELAAYLKHLKKSHRPLPEFLQLYNIFLNTFETNFAAFREHEWAYEIPRFKRFSLDGTVSPVRQMAKRVIPNSEKER